MTVLSPDQILVITAMMGGMMGFVAQRLFGLLARVAVLEAKLEALKEMQESLKELCREVHALRVEMARGSRGGERGKGYNQTRGGGGA